MTDTLVGMELLADSLIDSVTVANEVATRSGVSMVWMIVAIVEGVVLLVMLLSKFNGKASARDSELERLKRESKKESVDMDNIMATFKATELYDKLVKKYHPDRFVGDEEKVALANEIASRITQNKHNYKELLKLQQEAENLFNN